MSLASLHRPVGIATPVPTVSGANKMSGAAPPGGSVGGLLVGGRQPPTPCRPGSQTNRSWVPPLMDGQAGAGHPPKPAQSLSWVPPPQHQGRPATSRDLSSGGATASQPAVPRCDSIARPLPGQRLGGPMAVPVAVAASHQERPQTSRPMASMPSFQMSSCTSFAAAPPSYRAASPAPAQAHGHVVQPMGVAQAAPHYGANPAANTSAYCLTPSAPPPQRVMAVATPSPQAPAGPPPSHMPGTGRPGFRGSTPTTPTAARLPPQLPLPTGPAPGGYAAPGGYERPHGMAHSHSWVPPPMPQAAHGMAQAVHGQSWVPQPAEGPGFLSCQSLVLPPDAAMLFAKNLNVQWAPSEAGERAPAAAAAASQGGASCLDHAFGPSTGPLRFTSASASRQHPAKVNTGIVNADAVEEGETHLGICDGVSGVHHLGIPPDELPKDLLRSCRERLLARSGGDEAANTDDGTWLTSIIEEAYDSTEAYGATTLLLAAFRGTDLVTACLGDCALLVLRPSSLSPLRLRTIFKTEPGRYDSRRPVQVQRLHGFSDAHAHVVIKGAMVSTTPVQPGDVLILGSDGLFDNLKDEDIRRTVEQCCSSFVGAPGAAPRAPSQAQLRQTASALVDLAISRVKLDQPEGAAAPNPWNAAGGDVPANNADDTTALVSVVMQDDRDGSSSARGGKPSKERSKRGQAGSRSHSAGGGRFMRRPAGNCESRKEDCVIA